MTICTAETKSGRPCRAHAMRGTEPPRCVVHRQVTSSPDPEDRSDTEKDREANAAHVAEEIAELVAHAADDSLEDEIIAVRIATQRVLRRLSQKLDPDEFKQLTRLLFTGANTMARLLRIQRDLRQESDVGLADVISQALDELSRELGVDL